MNKVHPDSFDRTGKALVDKLDLTDEEALARLQQVQIEISVGSDLKDSPSLQAALLTLVNLCPRIFKRAAIILDPHSVLPEAVVVPFAAKSLHEAVQALGGKLSVQGGLGSKKIILGRAEGDGLRLSFDGWSARVGPSRWCPPLGQRERCVLAGIAGAGLALSEIFLGSMGFDIEAEKRDVGMSLWSPDEPVSSLTPLGPQIEFLPGEAWILGLGHLGQGILWSLSMLPYAAPSKMELLLQDFDRVTIANVGTQCLTAKEHVGNRKTRVCCDFLSARGFDPGIIDRPFDGRAPRTNDEPALALCGFDGAGPRHLLDLVQFERVVVCGVGGTAEDFDDIQIHTIPLRGKSAKELWPPRPKSTDVGELAFRNRFYRDYQEKHRCGQLDLAGVSVAVPFVGAVTGALAWAEVLRGLHGGCRGAFVGCPLRCLEERKIRYAADGCSPLRFARPCLRVGKPNVPN